MFKKIWRVIDAHTSLLEKSNKRINKAEYKITDLIECIRILADPEYPDGKTKSQQVIEEKLSRTYTGNELHESVGPELGYSAKHSWPPLPFIQGFTAKEVELIMQLAKAVRDGKPLTLTLSAGQRQLLANIIHLCSPSVVIHSPKENKRS